MPATVAAVLRDACVAPFFLTLIGDPSRWHATVPDLRHGEVATLPAVAYVAFGRHAGAPARAVATLPDVVFERERFLDLTAAAVAVTVRFLLDGTATARGAATMDVAVRDVERFGRDYLALMGPELAGLDLFSRRVVPA